jgi:hypothetical protein
MSNTPAVLSIPVYDYTVIQEFLETHPGRGDPSKEAPAKTNQRSVRYVSKNSNDHLFCRRRLVGVWCWRSFPDACHRDLRRNPGNRSRAVMSNKELVELRAALIQMSKALETQRACTLRVVKILERHLPSRVVSVPGLTAKEMNEMNVTLAGIAEYPKG